MILSDIVQKEEEIKKISYQALKLGTQEVEEKSVKTINSEILEAKYFGLATHYALEMMAEFDLKSINRAINLSKTKYLNFIDKIDFLTIEKLLNNLIQNSEFQALIKDAKIVQEQSLMYEGEIKILDLLLFKNDRYTIIDYKTTTEILASHKKQINSYKKAISKIFNTNDVDGYLFYLKEDRAELIKV